jgi:UDP-N-acetyl-D-mannosaminuronic acid transferase (WecB/TagA/CpsF family)
MPPLENPFQKEKRTGTVPRGPEWMGRSGFEWVYRFLKEPRKLWRRDLLDGPHFLFHAGMELIRRCEY